MYNDMKDYYDFMYNYIGDEKSKFLKQTRKVSESELLTSKKLDDSQYKKMTIFLEMLKNQIDNNLKDTDKIMNSIIPYIEKIFKQD